MGLFDALFGKNKKKQQQLATANYFKTLNAYEPVFRNYHGAIYESELVRASIDAIAKQCSKLNIVSMGTAKPSLQVKFQKAPNEFQTWSQFLYRLATILYVNNNAFIIPILDQFDEVSGIYPIVADECSLVESNGVVYLRYRFRDGKFAAIEYSRCGLMTRFQFKDDFFGENNNALVPTMSMIDINNQGIKEAVKSSATYRFMARINNFIKPEDLANERKRFTKENLQGDGNGLLLFPNTYSDIKQIDSKPYLIDANQMNIIKSNVFNYFGVNEKVIQGNATDEELDAFYNTAIEPFSIQLSEVLTKMLFTIREIGQGSKIEVASNRLQYMSVSHKVAMAQTLGDRGMLTIDEIRALFNYPPLPDGKGNFATIRGEYYNVLDDNSEGEDTNE